MYDIKTIARQFQNYFSRLKLFHLTYLTVNNRLRHVEFSNHTKRDGSSARLGVIHFTLEHNSVDSLFLCKDLCCTCSGRSSSYNSNLVLHAQGRVRSSTVCYRGSLNKGGGGEGGDRRSQSSDCCKSKFHFGFYWIVNLCTKWCVSLVFLPNWKTSGSKEKVKNIFNNLPPDQDPYVCSLKLQLGCAHYLFLNKDFIFRAPYSFGVTNFLIPTQTFGRMSKFVFIFSHFLCQNNVSQLKQLGCSSDNEEFYYPLRHTHLTFLLLYRFYF